MWYSDHMINIRGSFEYFGGELPGEAMEIELLGTVKDIGTIQEERKKVHDRMDRDNIEELEAAIEEVKERQTQNPIFPNTPFARFLHQEIDERIDLEDTTKLKFYSAVSNTKNKTMLDKDFGIDAFIEFEQETGEPIIVSIDVTLKPYKENPKADIVFSLPDDFPLHARFEKGQLASLSESDQKTFYKYVKYLAIEVADKIKKNLQSKKLEK